ncbi:Maltose/maltodextrin import ATP-binding protein MalK [Pseudovibrio axinellae]|uniref:Maltose/maltodextrin import ATP-binding protein MalK n=1 Tax=Pseudovibrio axinellae TaxID=989403 RepID=A0A166A4G0_9HYPH|nr:molybdenum ABC transporter ATP-binding protein [Pseudovibrio axinellae]KZL20615.1 Maltose/maltodextrin import ATP-binding protein MalK [Pseudovibrio axinellae]SER27819.1 molybdate transport system ATP-binding protein [Pseudovibrio axinellae]
MIDLDISSRVGDFSLSAKFAVNSGITAIFGRSGAGKSSLIRMIAGLAAPDAGRIVLAEQVVFDRDRSINVPIQQRGVGMVFQDSRLFPHMNVERNLLYSQWAAGRNSGVGLGEIAELLGISHLLKRRPFGLSGGEKQRVAIGRALLSNPKVLVLDEPLASLDASRKAEILPYLLKLKNEFGIPMLYVSHSLGEIEQLADTLVLLDQGSVVAYGPIAQMLSNLELPQLVNGPDAGSLLFAKFSQYDTHWQMTEFSLEGQKLFLPGQLGTVGQDARIRIKAKDVALARKVPEQASVRNVLCVCIEGITETAGPYAEVDCRVGEQHLRARLTRHSVHELQLAAGQEVFALVKSVALDQ